MTIGSSSRRTRSMPAGKRAFPKRDHSSKRGASTKRSSQFGKSRTSYVENQCTAEGKPMRASPELLRSYGRKSFSSIRKAGIPPVFSSGNHESNEICVGLSYFYHAVWADFRQVTSNNLDIRGIGAIDLFSQKKNFTCSS